MFWYWNPSSYLKIHSLIYGDCTGWICKMRESLTPWMSPQIIRHTFQLMNIMYRTVLNGNNTQIMRWGRLLVIYKENSSWNEPEADLLRLLINPWAFQVIKGSRGIFLPQLLQLVDLLSCDLACTKLLCFWGHSYQPGQHGPVINKRLPLLWVPIIQNIIHIYWENEGKEGVQYM